MGLIKKNSFIARIWEYLNSLTLNSAAAVIVIGRCMKKKIIKKMKHKNTEKIKCIHVWSNDKLIESFSEEESPFIERWNLYNKFILLYSGNMGRFHDMETIIAAAKELRNHQDILFLFVGEGHKKQWLINYSKKHSLTNCQFHSYVKREELGPLLAAADAGLVSLCSGQEGLSVPSKTFGLMAAGLPVIAVMNSTAEIALIIKEEQSGIVTRPGEVKELTEAILSLYKDSFKREQMGKNSLNAIHKKYNLHKATQYYLNIIEDLQL
ncbi:MAG: glycosyltransferase family 4 protein [bacterium]|nr:glycosyltransferase family 4 protein [bacterium]